MHICADFVCLGVPFFASFLTFSQEMNKVGGGGGVVGTV